MDSSRSPLKDCTNINVTNQEFNQSAKSGQLSGDHIVHENAKDQLTIGGDKSLEKSTSEQTLTGSSSTFSSAVELSSKEEFDTDGSPEYDSACENDAFLDQDIPNKLSLTLLAEDLEGFHISTPKSVLNRDRSSFKNSLLAFKIKDSEHCDSSLIDSSCSQSILNSAVDDNKSIIIAGTSVIENTTFTEETSNSGDRNESTCRRNLSEIYDDLSSNVPQNVSITSNPVEGTEIFFSDDCNKELTPELLSNNVITSSPTKITTVDLCEGNLSVQNSNQIESIREDICIVNSVTESTKTFIDNEISQSSANVSLDKNLNTALSVASNVSLPIESSSVDVHNNDSARNSLLVEEELCDKNKPEVKSEDIKVSLPDSTEEKLHNSSIIINSVLTNEEIATTVDNCLNLQINNENSNLSTLGETYKNINYDSKNISEIIISDNVSKEVSVNSFQAELKSNKEVHTHSEYSVDELSESASLISNLENCSVKLNLTAPIPIDKSTLEKDIVIQDINSLDLFTNGVPVDSVNTVKEIIGNTSPLPSCENKNKQDQSFEIVAQQSGVVEQSFEIVETNLPAETVEKSFEVVSGSPVSDFVEKSFEVVSSSCELVVDKEIPQPISDFDFHESNKSLNCSFSKTEEKLPAVSSLLDSTLKTELSFNELKSDEKVIDVQEILLNKVENNCNESLSVVSHEVDQLNVNNSQNINEDILNDNTANVSVTSKSNEEINSDKLVTEEKLSESVVSEIVTENTKISVTSSVQKIETSSLEIVEKSFEVVETNLPPEIVKNSIEVVDTNPVTKLISDKLPIQPISHLALGESILPSESTQLKTEDNTCVEHIVPDSNLKTELPVKEQIVSEFHDISLNKIENIVPETLSDVTDNHEQLSESINNSITEVTDLTATLLSNTETIYNKLVIDGTISETLEVSNEHNNIAPSESPFSVVVKESNSIQSSDILQSASDNCVIKGSEINSVNEKLENSTGDLGKIKSTLDCSIIEGINKLSVEEESNLNVSSKLENCSEEGLIKRRSIKDISNCVTKIDDCFANESIVDVEFEGYKSSLDSSADSSIKTHKINGDLSGFSVPEEVGNQDFDADSIEELRFDESLALEASKISETILNTSNDNNIQEDNINNAMNTPVSTKSPNSEIFIGKGQSVSTFINMHSGMNDYGKNEKSCLNSSVGNDVQITETSNNLDVNNSEAGPVTAEEFSSATEFQFDINYLSQAGQNCNRSRINSLTRQSLYVKFDPIVGKILSNTEESPQPSSESGEAVFRTPMKNPESERDGQLIVFTPGPSNVESCVNDSDFNKSEAGPATADNELSESSNNLDCTIEKPISSPKTPMKNSSIERKPVTPSTTTPSAPLEKSQSTPKSGQKTVVSQEVYHKEVQKLQDLMEQMVIQENKYKDELKSKNELIEKLQAEVNERDAKTQKEIQEKAKNIKQLGLILEEYERTISQMLAQKEEEKKEFENQKEIILKERDTAMTHLNNMEIAFNDVHQKYERSKTVIEGMKNNEDILKASLQDYEATIKKQEDKYNKLRAHAMAQLDKANLELDMLKRSHETEAARLNAIVKKSEIRITTLEEALDRKVKENLELTQLCDELISKVTGQSVDNPL